MWFIEGIYFDKFIRFRECSYLLVFVFNGILLFVMVEL